MSTPGTGEQPAGGAPAAPQGETDLPADVVGLRKAIEAERKLRQAAETKAAALETAQQEASRKAAEEAGKHRELYEGLKPKYEEAAAKLTAYEKRETDRIAALTARNTDRIAALPEDFRDLVPPGLDPDATTAHIEKLEARARKSDPGFAKGGSAAGAKKDAPGIPEEARAEALANGKDPQWWFDNVWSKRTKKKT